MLFIAVGDSAGIAGDDEVEFAARVVAGTKHQPELDSGTDADPSMSLVSETDARSSVAEIDVAAAAAAELLADEVHLLEL